MRLKTLIALASGALLTGCASKPSMPPMMCPPAPTPWECVQRCPDPPPTTLPRELWDLEMLQWGLGCKALHDDCAGELSVRG
jgi:hypothetical protein